MGGSPTRDTSVDEGRERWIFGYRVEGDIRFLSHRDMIRLFERALVRAALPVRYTEGFNPHARLSILLPRPVAIAADEEAIVIDFNGPIDGKDVAKRLSEATPAGIEVFSARRLACGERPRLKSARYRLELTERVGETIQAKVLEILDAEVVMIQRKHPRTGEVRSVDIRPSIVDLRIDQQRVIEFALCPTSNVTAKPAEIASLMGLDPQAINHRIRRTEIQWE
jgi:radical SAM-linked protein